MTLPVVMTTSGPIPNSPAALNADLIATVQAEDADFTANLPGLLLEDLTSTATAALAQIDQARVDAINSITPYGANAFILAQQGAMLGIPQCQPSNTNVLVVFYGSTIIGYVIQAGTIVSDGTYQYVIQTGGVIESSGQSAPLLAVASQSGTWAVPEGSVDQIAASLPSPYNTTCRRSRLRCKALRRLYRRCWAKSQASPRAWCLCYRLHLAGRSWAVVVIPMPWPMRFIRVRSTYRLSSGRIRHPVMSPFRS